MGRVPSNKPSKHRKQNSKSNWTSRNQSGNTERATGHVCDACNNTENIYRDVELYSKIEHLQNGDPESNLVLKINCDFVSFSKDLPNWQPEESLVTLGKWCTEDCGTSYSYLMNSALTTTCLERLKYCSEDKLLIIFLALSKADCWHLFHAYLTPRFKSSVKGLITDATCGVNFDK